MQDGRLDGPADDRRGFVCLDELDRHTVGCVDLARGQLTGARRGAAGGGGGRAAPLGLRLSPEKTRVVHIDEGFDFLGFHIRRRRKRGSQKQCVYTTPSRRSVQAAKDKVRWKTRRSTLHLDLAELITSLNQTLRGWATYFRHGVSSRAFHPSRPARLVADRGMAPREVSGQDPAQLEAAPPPFL